MDYQIIIKGIDKTNSVKSWRQIGDKIEITFCNDEKNYLYKKQNVEIISSALLNKNAKQRFEYLKRIATAIGLENEIGGNILANQYNKIDFVSSDSILNTFLTEKLGQDNSKIISDTFTLYPFGFNESQKNAVKKAQTNHLSIIEGPPGTGKTQTILNIIANAVMRGESVAVVSNNNSATKNVLEKLEKYEIDFIAAYLGSAENKKKFIEQQKTKLPDLSKWKLPAEKCVEINKRLNDLFQRLNEKLKKKNELSRLKQEFDAYGIEYQYYKQNFQNTGWEANFFENKNAHTVLEVWLFVENYIFIEKHCKTNRLQKWIKRLKFYFKYGKVDKSVFDEESKSVNFISVAQNQYYNKKIAEIKIAINIIEKELNNFDFDGKMKEYSELSLQIFRDKLTQKYPNRERKIFDMDELRKDSKGFIKEYPVILSTTYSLRNSLSNKEMYDYVIIDEASQVNLATGALALSCARKAVIVGDLKQLPNVVDKKDAEKTDTIFVEYNFPQYYRYKNHSILLSLTEMFPDVQKTLLREHYRCHPKIIEFCNQKFYNNQLIILSESKSTRKPLIVYKTVEGNHEREHINQRQIDVIKKEIIPQQQLENGISLGIVTPYRNQTNALQQAFAGTNIQADTVDKFQGRETDVIILSTVDNKISEFADNANRLNVAVSRAKDQLIVVVSGNDMKQDSNIGDLVQYVRYNNLEIVQSEISSVFDLLFKCYEAKRIEYLKNKKIVSNYDSENLFFSAIEEVLQEVDFQRFDVKVHIPMRAILHNTEYLTDEEAKYAMNQLTHFDFLIFDKISKLPQLVVEVDGEAFHKKGTPQSRRDDLKNSILEKINLPYIRFNTNGSEEKEKLRIKLKNIS
ncbi:MAG: DUF2726 domain-containing protein [Candidatus Symbiothrix sp.]|nr:DUF2726 domain-containing protein [Candidatus Symbiothrix sp.]